jgi:hypothetical protein
MKEITVTNVTDNLSLPAISVDGNLKEGDPVEINQEMYFVCERFCSKKGELESLGVIPLIVRNPLKVQNINDYIKCLSIAHRRVKFIKDGKECCMDECDEMRII